MKKKVIPVKVKAAKGCKTCIYVECSTEAKLEHCKGCESRKKPTKAICNEDLIMYGGAQRAFTKGNSYKIVDSSHLDDVDPFLLLMDDNELEHRISNRKAGWLKHFEIR